MDEIYHGTTFHEDCQELLPKIMGDGARGMLQALSDRDEAPVESASLRKSEPADAKGHGTSNQACGQSDTLGESKCFLVSTVDC